MRESNDRAGLKLNLGCGSRKFEGWLNVDGAADCEPDMILDLEQTPWPWADDSVDAIRLIHVLEHLGQDSRTHLNVIREIHRVCRHGAHVFIVVPHPRHEFFLSDPTHVRPITPLSLQFFDKAVNREWRARGFANTPLALHMDVDLRVARMTLKLDEGFRAFARRLNLPAEELLQHAGFFANAVEQIDAHLVVVKRDVEGVRWTLATPRDMEPRAFAVRADAARDVRLTKSILSTGQWKPVISLMLTRILRGLAAARPRTRVLNFDANIGWYVLLSAMAAPNIVVDALEPGAENFAICRENVETNGLGDRVVLRRMAVAEAGSVEAELVSLDDMYADGPRDAWPDVAVIDARGCGERVMRGAARLLDQGWRPLLLMEFRPGGMKERGGLPEFPARLRELGWSFFRVNAAGGSLEPVTAEWLEQWAGVMAEKSRDAFIDIVAAPRGLSLPDLLA